MAMYSSLSFILMKFVSLFVILCGTWFVIDGQMTYGQFITFVILSNVFLAPMKQISGVLEMYPKGIAGFKRFVELLGTEPDVRERPDARDVNTLKGDMEYRDVSFGYEGKERVFKNVSLSVRAGETVALVGPSGGGKTTLCSLLPRFYDDSEGSITIDGIEEDGIAEQGGHQELLHQNGIYSRLHRAQAGA